MKENAEKYLAAQKKGVRLKSFLESGGHYQPSKFGTLEIQKYQSHKSFCVAILEASGLDNILEKRRATAHGTTEQRDNGTTGHRANGTTGQRDTGTTGQRDNGTPGQRDTRSTGQRANGPTGRRETTKPTGRANGTMAAGRENSKGNTHGINKRASQATKLDDGWPESVEEHVTLF